MYPNMSERELHSGELLITELQNWAQEHAEKSDGQMVSLPFDPNSYPGQDTETVSGNPQAPALVDSIAAIAQPRYGEILELLDEQEEKTGEVSRIGELLRAGNNVMLVTNHSDLIDIAVTHAAFYSRLKQHGYSEFKTGIVISKMVAFLGIKFGNEFAGGVETLKLLEDKQFLSYPRTDSAKTRGITSFFNEVDRHNRKVRDELNHFLGKGAAFLALAPSGTVDKPRKDDPNTIVMSPVGNGTQKMMQADKTYITPVAVWYGSETPVFETCDIPRVMLSPTMAHVAMHKIARRLTERVKNKSFVYNEQS